MMTLMARLCAVCAVCSLFQAALGDADESGGMRLIGGLLMLHVVLSGVQNLAVQLAGARELMRIFEILMK